MATKFPEQVSLDPDEIYRVNRIRIAQHFHKFPHEIDDLPASEVDDILELMWVDAELNRQSH